MSFPPENQEPQQQGQSLPQQPQVPTATQVTEPLQPQTQAYPPQAPAYPPQAPRQTLPTTLAQTNAFALVSILTVFLQPIAGIVFGHMALSQIKRNGDSGRGLALTGLIIGYAYFVFIVMALVFYISMIGIMLATAGAAFSDFSDFDTYSYN